MSLRVGDVSRDSGPDSLSQSGDTVHVEKNDVDITQAANFKDELKGFDVSVGDNTLTVTEGMSDEDIGKIEKSKQVHIGEQNIVDNHTEFKDGRLTHTITVNDGNYAPWCTGAAIEDHLGELASAKNTDSTVEIKFEQPCDPKTQEKYDEWKKQMNDSLDKYTGEKKYSNVEIVFPWEGGNK